MDWMAQVRVESRMIREVDGRAQGGSFPAGEIVSGRSQPGAGRGSIRRDPAHPRIQSVERDSSAWGRLDIGLLFDGCNRSRTRSNAGGSRGGSPVEATYTDGYGGNQPNHRRG